MPVHALLVVLAVCIAWAEGHTPSIYTLQIFYYFLGMNLLLLGVGTITASTQMFAKDVGNVVAMIVQFGFWLTPIFWNLSLIPEKYHYLIQLNPMYYVVNGYRSSIAAQVPFWEDPISALYFWSFTLLALSASIIVYRKLKPHFAEVI